MEHTSVEQTSLEDNIELITAGGHDEEAYRNPQESFRTPGVSFLDEVLNNWSHDIKLYGGSYLAAFNRLPDDALDEDVGTEEEKVEWSERALSPVREDYLGNEARKNLTYQNGTFWDKAKTLAADLLSPTNFAAVYGAGGIVKGVSSLPIIEKLGLRVAEWGQGTFGGKTAVRYLGKATKGATEFLTFEGLTIGEKKLIDIPVENVGEHLLASAALGAITGGAVAAFRRKAHLNELNRQLCYPEETFNPVIKGTKEGPVLEFNRTGPASVGSMEAPKPKFLPKIFQWGPLAQSWNSKSQVVRQMSETYFGNMFAQTETGGLASITDMMQSDRGRLAEYVIEYNNHLKRFAGGTGSPGKRITSAIKRAFNQEWLNGAIEGGKTSNAIINGFVSKTREIFRSMGKEAVELGLLPEKILEKEYFPQYYDKRVIGSDREGWLNALRNGLIESNPRLSTGTYNAGKDIERIVRDIDETVYWNRTEKKRSKDGAPIAASLKKRDIHIDQKFLRDYLVSDPVGLMESYVTSMGFNIAEKKALKRLGYNDFKEVMEALFKEAGGYLDDPTFQAGRQLLEDMPGIVSGKFDAARRREFDRAMGGSYLRQAIGAMQDLNVARYLGGLGLSGLVDLAANAAKGTTCKHIAGLINHQRLGGLTKEECIAAGFCIDDILAEIRQVASETTLDDAPSLLGNAIGKFRESVTQPLAEAVVRASGIRFIDGLRERVSACLNCLELGERILKGEKKVGKLEGEILERIKDQLEKYKTINEDGTTFYNLSSWEDAGARFDFEAEIRRGVRGEIYRPNRADVPNALRHPMAKVFGMFYSFGFGMWNSVILPMAMEGRYGQLAVLVGATAAYEMLGEVLKGHIRGNPYDLDNQEEVEKLAYRALSRSPVLSHLASGVNIITFGKYGDSQVKSGTDLAASMIKGGNLSFAIDAFDAIQSAGEVIMGNRPQTQKELRRQIKILPFQNHLIVRPLFNMLGADLPKGK